jgi:hypothetical protein
VKRTCLLFLPLIALLAEPKQPNPIPCSPSLSNSTCFIEIDTALPVSPLPIQLNSGAAVTLYVKKRGVEKVLVETEWKEIDTPDPALELVKSFLPALGKLRFDTSTNVKKVEGREFLSITRVNELQDETDKTLKGLAESMEIANAGLTELGKFPKAQGDTAEFNKTLASVIDLTSAATKDSTSLRAIDESIKLAAAELTRLMEQPTSDEGKIERLRMAIDIVDLRRNRQATALKNLTDAQDALRAIQRAISGLPETRYMFSSRPITPPTGNWLGTTATIKLTAVDAVTGTKKTLSTITLSWNTTRWEISAGAIFSSLPDRSFSLPRNVLNGAAITDPKFTVAQTTNRPTVVPVALAHYRVFEKLTTTHRRFAVLVTGGIGVNPTSATADFLGGLSIGYRGLLFTPGVHFGRDIRLINGVKIGTAFAESFTLPTQRFWTPAFAIGITYRIPFK